ncbi:MAG: protein kinase [Vicinamibacteria bacterium]|nr:protein kinase [Vicinamibacteria bacterium]
MTSQGSAARNPAVSGEYRIGRYRVRARLGKGGMGVVYLGRDEALDRDVAIKTLRVDGASDTESRGRFEIEAKAAARLQHPNIVTVFELGEDRGLPYIAMELLGGQDLETLLRSREPLSATERLDIVIQSLRGLDFAHTHHIVHRDIKPSNIRVLDDGGVKILDFGIAKVESTSMTQAGMMVGTPYYMSPEHIRGGVLDGRTDVFAVGVILHELFAGKRPFTSDDPTRVLYRIVNEPHPRLGPDVAGRLTADVQRVIDRALEKDVEARYASAAVMADELARVRERFPAPQLTAEDLAALSQARKVFAAQKTDKATVEVVERIARAHPDAAEAQRLRRLLHRRPGDPHQVTETASFPELDATFNRSRQGDETIVEGRTISGSANTVTNAQPQSAPVNTGSNALVFGAVGLAIATGSVAAFLYVTRTGDAPSGPEPTPTITEIFVPGGSGPAPAKAAEKAPAPASRGSSSTTAAPPRTAPPSKSISAAPVPPSGPAGVDSERKATPTNAAATPSGPPGSLVIESSYPVTVSVAGRVIGSEKAGLTASLPAGAHEVLVESPSVFLRHRETVRIEAGGSASVRVPATGKLGVRASPDNCKVLVNGVFLDYPPILDRAIASGNHVITFEWPDGARSEERVLVQPGKPAYVMGRKP